jgi:DNA invertase Pin-like site-specific DNA recombinase
MSNVYGYVCMGRDQPGIIQQFCAARGFAVSRLFQDGAEVRGSPWLSRPALSELTAALRPGDALVITSLAPIYSSRRDLLTVLRALQARDIALHIAGSATSPSLTVSGTMWNSFLQTLDVLFAFNTRVRGEAIREALHTRRICGRRFTNFAPYGYKWQRSRGEQRCVPDSYERATIAQIVEWRDGGASWSVIATRLLRSRVVTAAGREWSSSRARRVYVAATRGRSRPAT